MNQERHDLFVNFHPDNDLNELIARSISEDAEMSLDAGYLSTLTRKACAGPDWPEDAGSLPNARTRDKPVKGGREGHVAGLIALGTAAININTRARARQPGRNVNSGPFSLAANKCALQSPRYGNPVYAYPSTLPAGMAGELTRERPFATPRRVSIDVSTSDRTGKLVTLRPTDSGQRGRITESVCVPLCKYERATNDP